MAKRTERSKKKRRVGGARRCLQALEILAGEPYLVGLAEISGLLSLPKSSTHRLLGLLIEAGYVELEPITRRYSLTPKVLWIGSSYLRNSPVERSALTVLSRLSEETGTTSHVGVWDSGKVLLLHSTDPPNAISLFVEVGERRPVHASALGKALLAFRSAADLNKICDGGFAQFTPRTKASRAAIEEELLRVREAGVAIDDEEYAPGMRCIAAPIRDQQGVVAALGISGDLSLIGDDAIPRLSRLVLDAALRCSAQLGYRPSSGQFSTSRVALAAAGRTPSSAEADAPMGAGRRNSLVPAATADQPGH
jgi:IclR family transcriptional regulator, acetate operon repressor